MAMTRRDYVAVSNILASHYGSKHLTPDEIVECITADLADLMARDNPKFDRDQFIAASRSTSKGA